jgi:WD repeat-containing protein 19
MFLIGEIDGIPKDPKFIYQLNIAIGKIKEASQTAMLIAQEEIEGGTYDEAHKILFTTIRDMK